MKKLYPLKFKPVLKDKIWGGNKLHKVLDKAGAGEKCGESWEISAVEGNVSEVAEGFLAGNNLTELIEIYMGDLIGEKVYDQVGNEFPLLIKYIDANDDLSIQVHPGDDIARERHNSRGKTEMWYIIDTVPGSKLISGFNRNLTRDEYLKALNSGKLSDVMNYEDARPGDIFFMPSGRVHAIGSGILLAEIQQSSDVTYRIFDYNRKDDQGKTRELHTDAAIDVLDLHKTDRSGIKYDRTLNKTINLVECPYFTTNIMEFDKIVEKDFNFIDSFVIYMCVEGSLSVLTPDNEGVILVKGDTVLIPAEIKNAILSPAGKTKVLEIYQV